MKKRTKITVLLISVLSIICLMGLALVVMGSVAWRDFDPALITDLKQTLLVYDGKGQVIAGVYGTENRTTVPIESVPEHVKNAFIAVEDVRFYSHSGIDIKRIFGAILEDIKQGSYAQGASTLTQQLIKLSHLTPQKTLSRKVQEALLAMEMERRYEKDEILEMYLNYVYFGAGAYGIEAAAQTYFGVSAPQLSVAQGALLAGVVKSPSNYAPHLNLTNSVNRRDLVLELMHQYEFIDDKQYQASLSEKTVLVEQDDTPYPYGYYMEYAMRETRRLLDITQEELISGGYRVYTTLDTQLQTTVEGLFLDDALFPPPASDSRVEGAFAAIDPATGAVTALLGGREHVVQFGLDRATQVRRQPGSAIKPVMVYAPALEVFGYSAASLLMDEPTDFSGYTPRNFGDNYHGWVTLRQAVASSLNVPAVKVLSDIGVASAKNFAQKLGVEFDPKDTGLTLALGGFTYGVTPLELCAAYGAFAAQGSYTEPYSVLKVTDVAGNVLYQAEPRSTQVMSQANAFILTSMLQSVVETGTGRRLNIGMGLAGKTGTTGLPETGGNKDAWMAAYNRDLACTVWMGFDDTDSYHSLPSEATGGTYPAAILARVFESVYPDALSAPQFEMPPGVRQVRLDYVSLIDRQEAVLANALTPASAVKSEYFTEATAPDVSTSYWVVPTPTGEIALVAAQDNRPVVCFTPAQKFVMYRVYRSDGTNTVLLAEYPGDEGDIRHHDVTASYGVEYTYYVTPVHPELEVAGQQVQGPESRAGTFTATAPLELELGLRPGTGDKGPAEPSAPAERKPEPAATPEPSPSQASVLTLMP